MTLTHTAPDRIVTIDFSEALPNPAYDIVIGKGIGVDAATLIKSRLGVRSCVVVSDSNVAPLYQRRFEEVLSAGATAF
jgi:3-dehydroquinate synthetase